MKNKRMWSIIGAVAAIVGGLTVGHNTRPTPPTPACNQDTRQEEFRATCLFYYQRELGRDIDPSGLDTCLAKANRCESGEQIATWLHDSEEGTARRERPPLPPEAPPLPNAGETQQVHVDGPAFKRADGSLFPWIGADSFRLDDRFLLNSKELDPYLTDMLTKSDGTIYAPHTGPNVLRVFLSYAVDAQGNGIGTFRPADHPDFYTRLPEFVDRVNARGFLPELTVLADAPRSLPGADLRAHLDKIAGVLTSKPRAFLIEVANEPWQNIPGGNQQACDLAFTILDRGFPVASGQYDFDANRCVADYITYHSPRKFEWVRTSKDLQDIRDWAHRPVVGDEPTGFAELARGDSRSTSTDDAAWHAAGCQLFGAGCTFHSDSGIQSVPFGPAQRAAFDAWVWGARWAPVGAQLSAYARGDASGPCNWVGESFVEHDDNKELRSFGKAIGNRAWVIQIHTTREHATACAPWHITAEPRKGFVELAR